MFLIFLLVFASIFSIARADEIRYDRGQRRDPFTPLNGSAFLGNGSSGTGLAIEGIVYDPRKSSYVIIGGKIYREGETVDEAKVIKIFPDRVLFLQQGEETVIWLREEILQTEQKKTL